MSENNSHNKEFKKPKLSIKVILVSGLLPLIIAAMPFLLGKDSLIDKDVAIIILAVLCAGLVICVISLILDSYDEAFQRQVLELEVKELARDYAELKVAVKENTVLSELIKINQRLDQHEQDHEFDQLDD